MANFEDEPLDWNTCFKDKSNLQAQHVMQRFWRDVKDRLLKRYGEMQHAFAAIVAITQGEGDVSLKFADFCEVLKCLQIHLEPRIARAVFESASGGARLLPIMQLKELLMAQTITKIRSLMEGCTEGIERVQLHVGFFLKHLHLQEGRACKLALERFQNRLTADFCRSFQQMLLADAPTSSSPYVHVGRATFQRIVSEAVGKGLQAYDAVFMTRIFHQVERRFHSVARGDIIAIFLLLSQDQDRCRKLQVLFDLFDSDYDGCILWDQLQGLIQCLCRQRPAIEEHSRAASDPQFQEELSIQQSARIYEQVRWHLQHGAKLQDGIVSLSELWQAFMKQEDLLQTLMPNVIRIDSWCLSPITEETQEGDQRPGSNNRKSSRTVVLPTPSKLGSRAASKMLDTTNLSSNGNLGQRGSKFASTPSLRSTQPAADKLAKSSGALTLANTTASSWNAERSRASRFSSKGVTASDFMSTQQSTGLDDSQELTSSMKSRSRMSQSRLLPSRGQLPPIPDSTRGEALRFKQARTNEFKQSLQHLGATRLAELKKGFMTPTIGNLADDLADHSSPSSEFATPMRSGAKEGSPVCTVGDNFLRIHDVPVIPPRLSSQTFGRESVERFRLVATMKVTGVTGAPDKGVGYMCQLCDASHSLQIARAT